MFAEIENDETRKLAGALLVSVSLASAVVVLFVNWFVNRFISPRTVNTTLFSPTSYVASAENLDSEIVGRQQQLIQRLEGRVSELEGALRDLKVRLGEPQVPVLYQATPASRLRYSDGYN
jgi:hypothetical protein